MLSSFDTVIYRSVLSWIKKRNKHSNVQLNKPEIRTRRDVMENRSFVKFHSINFYFLAVTMPEPDKEMEDICLLFIKIRISIWRNNLISEWDFLTLISYLGTSINDVINILLLEPIWSAYYRFCQFFFNLVFGSQPFFLEKEQFGRTF